MNPLASHAPNIQNVLEQIINICKSDDNVLQILLFGSRAKGAAMERSDIDIALVGNNIDVEKLRDEVEQIDTLLKIDLVDLSSCKNELLKSEVSKDGVAIFSKV